MEYIGDSKPSVTIPHHLSLSPKFMGPSIACMPYCSSHCLAVSSNIFAVFWLLMHSKKPIPPTVISSPLFLYFLFVNAAMRPIKLPFSSFKIHLTASPKRQTLFFFLSKISLMSLSKGCIQLGSFLYNCTATFINC